MLFVLARMVSVIMIQDACNMLNICFCRTENCTCTLLLLVLVSDQVSEGCVLAHS